MGDGLKDETRPDGRWEFDAEVTRVFDDMLRRSIPQLDVMRAAVAELAVPPVESSPTLQLVDLGCSRGAAMAPIVEQVRRTTPFGEPKHVGVEVSAPMAAAARHRFAHRDDVVIVEHDIRQGFPPVVRTAGSILLVLTLQFVPINYRQRILRECRQHLGIGGRLILVEKVLGEGPDVDSLMIDLYHESKVAAGYSPEDVARKSLSLEGVLVPATTGWNVEMLRRAGFREVDCFWRWMNFSGWVALV